MKLECNYTEIKTMYKALKKLKKESKVDNNSRIVIKSTNTGIGNSISVTVKDTDISVNVTDHSCW